MDSITDLMASISLGVITQIIVPPLYMIMPRDPLHGMKHIDFIRYIM